MSTGIVRIDHATINTTDLGASIAFYGHFLELAPGWRPDFGFGGAWLYARGGDDPIVHLIEIETPVTGPGMFDHLAFRAIGLPAYLAKVRASGAWFRAAPVAETSLTQVHHLDPNGVTIEATFDEPLGADEVVSVAPSPSSGPARRPTT